MMVCQPVLIGGQDPSRRRDPFFGGLGAGAQAYFWCEVKDWRSQFGGRDWCGWRVSDAEEAWGRVEESLLLSCSIVSVVCSYRTVTVEQLGVFVGKACDERLMGHVMDLFAVGLVGLGRFVGAMEGDRLWTVAVARGRSREAWWRLRRMLTREQRWAVSLGSRMSRGLQHERHNLITSEILLRACQFVPGVVTVGEAHALIYPMLGVSGRGTPRGDGVVLFAHGGAMVVETCGSALSMEVEGKVQRWGEALHASRLDPLPFVVFVDARGGECRDRLRRSVASSLRRLFPGQYFASSIWSRIGVVSYEDWFGVGGVVREGFGRLCVECFDVASGVWSVVSVVESMPESGVPYPLFRGACASLVTPWWTRSDPYPLWVVDLPDPWWGEPRRGVSGGVWFEPWSVKP